MKHFFLLCLIVCMGSLLLPGCNGSSSSSPLVTFILSVENTGAVHAGSGVFDTPYGETTPSPIGPNSTYAFDITATEGDSLSFATMMVQSNDKFYAPDGDGIDLFPGGVPISGFIHDQVQLWDAGTEVDQEPGVGVDQAPRQTAPDTGADENGLVGPANDGFTYPTVDQIMEIQIQPVFIGPPTRFSIAITNLSDANTLSTSLGSTDVPLASGVWVVHSEANPLFEVGTEASPELEALAEDGNAAALGDILETMSGFVSPIAPGVWLLNTVPNRVFTQGQADFGEGLEALAEDGDPSDLAQSMAGKTGVAASGIFDTPYGGGSAGPAVSGTRYQIQFDAEQGQFLTFATMLVQSNDLFFAPSDSGIPLFSGENPISGDITSLIRLWDAGTEVNQEPGVGPDQAPRQTAPNTGADEGGLVQLIGNVNDGFTWPAVADIVTVTLVAVN